MELLTQPVTADNFLEVASLPEYADQNIELVEGEIVTMPTTNRDHSETLGLLTSLISVHILANRLGKFYVGEAGVILERNAYGRDTVRGLDFAFISKDRLPQLGESNLLDIAPDLAIEVISPSNSAADMHRKVDQLMDAGTRQVWVVYPDSRDVDVHTADGAITYREGDSISGGDILPGFEIAVADMFPR